MCMCGDSECPSCGVAQGTRAMKPADKGFIAARMDEANRAMTQAQREELTAIIHAAELTMVSPRYISKGAIAIRLVQILSEQLPEEDRSLVLQVLGVAGAA